MRATTIQQFGDPDGMVMTDLPEPVPAAGQVLIQTEAVGVGGVDAVIRRGTLGSGWPVGMIPGSEVAGTVVGVGPGSDSGLVGRRVWAFTGTDGAYAEQAVARVGDVVALPDGLSSIDAVTLGSAAPVAHFALAQAHTAQGDSVLIRGAAGSIGIAAVELAHRLGAGSIAVTTSSEDRGRRLRALGATVVLDRAGRGSDAAPASFDVVIDIVGGAAVPDFIDRLAPNGRMVLVGAVGGFPPSDFGMRLMRSFQQSRSIGTFSLDSIPPVERDRVRAGQFDAAAGGDLHAVVHDVMPLDQAAEAHRRMDAGEVFGRIVLVP
ncbi:zinc-binding dehydrogenase [Curtobacterium sp. VKM Ac-2865]|uniref:zinc-binding dehydrogenase n=1 Tax=Curtobacterium sp. VKM Ac-2865 TaxID=2783817 RepID=UPI00188D7212|nr:zinc-binding dehydrogenase [Curtobacterium sp. VKM Ac-2865]MBF4581643.1 zinc-binding dehydrogenase [Curtobacterium sp. VKM Ac-2865]